MSAVLERVDPSISLARIHRELDALAELDLAALSDDQLLDYERDRERVRRRLSSLDHASITEIEGRRLPETLQLRSVTHLLRGLLRLDPAEAAGRVRAAEAAGPRRTVTGQPLAPIYPVVAAAQAAGEISERQARVVMQTVDKLPEAAQAEHGREVEAQLVGYCAQFDPLNLAKLAERILAYHDPDGRLEEVEHREKHRDLTVQQRVDGSSKLSGELTAEATELLLLHFDALARPKPEVDGVKDPRTAGQRRHDALLEALKLNVRAQTLPTIAGITATIVLTMTADQYEQRRGLARTGHGALVPVEAAMRITGGEYRLMNLVIDKTKGITAYSSTARLHSELQRLGRAAIDGGCTFPNCPAPPGWCEIDHVIDHAHGGPTRVDLAVLACRHHNNTAKKQGWRSTLINGRAAWIPPRWIDPRQEPRYNHLHDTEPPPVE